MIWCEDFFYFINSYNKVCCVYFQHGDPTVPQGDLRCVSCSLLFQHFDYMPPQSRLIWYKNYFELKAFRKQSAIILVTRDRPRRKGQEKSTQTDLVKITCIFL